MKNSTLTSVTRAYFCLGALLVMTFLMTTGPHMANQTSNVWMAFGIGLALIAYGRSSIATPWLSLAFMAAGTLWLGVLTFLIFGVADL